MSFLYGAHETDSYYPFWNYAMGSSVITCFLFTKPISLDRYVLAAIQEPVALLGGPVFLRDGTLIGVLSGLSEDETIPFESLRPPLIVGGFFGVKRIWSKT